MIVIKEMEIPNRCAKCKFCLRQGTNNHGSFGKCLLQKNKRVNCLAWNRDDNCPLVEVVTCKDCKYWDKEEGYCKPSSGTIEWADYIVRTSADSMKHGHWKKGVFADITCSNCDFSICVANSVISKMLYCPNCGAKMDENTTNETD